jgi:hypothetical protein
MLDLSLSLHPERKIQQQMCDQVTIKTNDFNPSPLTTSKAQTTMKQNKTKQGVCHTVALPFTFKSILRQKKNYENSNISPCKNTIFKKSSKRNQNPSRHYYSVTNLKFQHKPKYNDLSKILI